MEPSFEEDIPIAQQQDNTSGTPQPPDHGQPPAADKFGNALVGRGGDLVGVPRGSGRGGVFESLTTDDAAQEGEGRCGGPGDAQKSVEGWILFVSGLPKEYKEEDVLDLFLDYGEVRLVRLNLDVRNCQCMGHAFVEFATFTEAANAQQKVNGIEKEGCKIIVTCAFVIPPPEATAEVEEEGGETMGKGGVKRERLVAEGEEGEDQKRRTKEEIAA